MLDGRVLRLAYSRRFPPIEEHHRRALADVIRSAKEPLQACRSDGSEPSLPTPTKVPKPLFIGPDGRDVEAVNNESIRESTDARRGTPGPGSEEMDGESTPAKAVWRPSGTAPRLAAGGRGRRQTPPLPLAFASSFECGNLLSARLVQTNPVPEASGAAGLQLEYELEMESDTQTTGRTQWFYFACYNSVPCTVTFRIVNFRKKRSLYRCGMQPHVCSVRDGGVNWDATACNEVMYTPNSRRSSTGGTMFTLSFRYEFRHTKDTVFFACHAPYSYSMLQNFFSNLVNHPDTREHACLTSLCRSVSGVKVPLLLVSSDLPAECCGPDPGYTAGSSEQASRENSLAEVLQKPAVVIIARQHPGETVGSWVMAGLIRFLVSNSSEAKELRDRFCFHIVPMVNVDGVIYGNARCTLTGYDPNRCWLNPDPVTHPVVYSLREYLSDVQNRCGVSLFLDLHGHSQRTAAFFYGVCPEEMRSALFPKLASLATRDVDFDGCRWRFGKAHEKTARAVAYTHCGIFNSFTLETSFFAQRVPDCSIRDLKVSTTSSAQRKPEQDRERARLLREVLFVPDRTESIGNAVGHAMASFFEANEMCSTSCTPTSQQTAAREDEAQHSGCKTFDGPAAPSWPWLTYQELRRVSVESVLADLEARGSTVFDLARSEGEDGPDSDSDCEDDGSTSASRPAVTKLAKPPSRQFSRQFSRHAMSDDDLPSPASSGKTKCRRRSIGMRRDGKRGQAAPRGRQARSATGRGSLARSPTSRKSEDRGKLGTLSDSVTRFRQHMESVANKTLPSASRCGSGEACNEEHATDEEEEAAGQEEAAHSPKSSPHGLTRPGSAGDSPSETSREHSLTVKPPETLELLMDRESAQSPLGCPIWAAALQSSRPRPEQDKLMATWQAGDIEESPAATSRTSPSAGCLSKTAPSPSHMEDMTPDLTMARAWPSLRPPTRRARIIQVQQSASTGSLYQQKSPAPSCASLQAVDDYTVGKGLRLTAAALVLGVASLPPEAQAASGAASTSVAVVAAGPSACSGIRTAQHQSRELGLRRASATSAMSVAAGGVSSVRSAGRLRSSRSFGQILNSGPHFGHKQARGCDQSGEKGTREQRTWERWIVRE